MKVKSESEVAQSCPTLSDPMDCSLPGSSVHGIFQARVLEWGAIAFSDKQYRCSQIGHCLDQYFSTHGPEIAEGLRDSFMRVLNHTFMGCGRSNSLLHNACIICPLSFHFLMIFLEATCHIRD